MECALVGSSIALGKRHCATKAIANCLSRTGSAFKLRKACRFLLSVWIASCATVHTILLTPLTVATVGLLLPMSSSQASECVLGVTAGSTNVLNSVTANTAGALTSVATTLTTDTAMKPILYGVEPPPPPFLGTPYTVLAGGNLAPGDQIIRESGNTFTIYQSTYNGSPTIATYGNNQADTASDTFNAYLAYRPISVVTGVDITSDKGNFVTDVKAGTTAALNSLAVNKGGATSVLNGLACGNGANAGDATATAVGPNANAATVGSSAFGNNAQALAVNSSTFGNNAKATGPGATAFGDNAQASGPGSTALGKDAKATATNSTAVGKDAVAAHDNSTALGSGAMTTRPDQMMLGTVKSTYTAPGITSAASRAAQTGPTEVVTSDAAGNLATDGGAITSQINQAFRRIDENSQGVAIALAMGGIYIPPTKNFSLTGGYGNFAGHNAFATQMALRLDNSTILTGGLGLGLANGDVPTSFGSRVGFQYSW